MLYQLIFLAVIAALVLLGVALNVLCWLQIRAFLRTHAVIACQQDFDELKGIIKVNMYAALAFIAIVGVAALTAAVALMTNTVDYITLLIGLFAVGGWLTVGGATMKAVERDLRNLPVEDPDLREEHAHVVKRWTSSAFPDW